MKHSIAVMGRNGDTKVLWDTETDTEEARAAVAEAERLFAEHTAKGAAAFKQTGDGQHERIDTFDPNAESIVIVPRMMGG